MKLLKWIVIILGAGVILFAGALAFIAATFDPNQYKQQLADLVKEKTQRTLTIEGDIRLLLFPKLGVYLGKTRLSGFRNEQDFAGLDEMRVSLALIPLLSRQVVVDQVQLVGLHAGLVKYKDGKTNFDDLLGGGETQKPEPQKPETTAVPEPAAPIRFDVEGIRVGNAALSWRDEAAGAEYKVSNIEIKTGRVAEKVPVKFELGAAFSASKPKLDVTLQSAGTLTADLQNQTYALAVLTAAVKAIGPQLDARLDLKLSDLQTSPAMLRIGDVLVSVDAKQAGNAVKGRLSTPVNANLENQLFELPKLAGEFDITAPALPMKTLKLPLAGALSADLKQQMVNVDLTTKLEESSIKARLGLSRFDALFTRFDVEIDKLNLDRYLPPAQPKSPATSQAPADGGQAPEQPIDFSPIKSLNLAGSLRIGDFVASNIKVQNLRVDVKSAGGKLDINPLLADLYQGSVKGSATVNANNNQIAIKQNLAGVQIGPLLRDAANQDLLEGRGDVMLDLTTAGNTVSAFKKALNGKAALKLQDGALKGINLAQSLRNARSMFTGGARESEQAAAGGEKTDFSEMSASFVIRNGVARNDDLLAKSPFLRLTGEGEINLVESSLNYLAKAAVVATSSGQEGKDLADLNGLTVPVRASGPFSALKYKLDFGSAFSAGAKQQLEQKKDELMDKLKSRLPGATAPAAAEEGAAAQQQKPADDLKDRLKKLF